MIDPLTKIVAAVAATGVIAIAGALDSPKDSVKQSPADTEMPAAEYEIITGLIHQANVTDGHFTIIHYEGDPPTQYTCSDQTRYLYNGEASDRVALLRPGSRVAVRHVEKQVLIVTYLPVHASQ